MTSGWRFVAFLGVMSAGSMAWAQDPSIAKNKEILDLIAAFAKDICTEVPLNSHSTSTALSGKAEAGLPGLLAKVTRLDVGAEAKVENVKHEGIRPEDLPTTIKTITECRQEMTRVLAGKMFGGAEPATPVKPAAQAPAPAPAPAAANAPGEFPKTLPAGGSAKAAHAKYTILAAELDQYSDEQMTLKLKMRFTNDGDAWADRTVMAENFRLLIGDVALSPTQSINETVDAGSTKEGNVEFLIPAGTTSAKLRVGRPEYGISTIPINLSAEH